MKQLACSLLCSLGLIATGLAQASPTVELSSPVANASYNAPASIALNAVVTGGEVSQVAFYHGSTYIGADTTAPYSWLWTNIQAGTYSLTARITDSSGTTLISTPVSVTVSASNTPPTVVISSPSGNQTLSAPSTVMLSANASDSDGSIQKVEFYRDGVLLGTVTSAPYTVPWSITSGGSYQITAKATDNQGLETISRSVTYQVNHPPAVALSSPLPGQAISAPATLTLTADASDSDGSIQKVEFYRDGVLLGAVTTAPYQLLWSNVPAGTYSLTAKAWDNRWQMATSAPVSVTIGASTGGVYYLHTDHLNTPRLVTNEQNTVVWRNQALAEPFGTSPPEEDPDGNGVPFTLNLRFPGQYFDKESNLSYNYFRDCYDPVTGRYCQPDPLGLRGGDLSLYLYAKNNPLRYTDRLGLASDDPLGGGASRPPLGIPNVSSEAGARAARQLTQMLNNLVEKLTCPDEKCPLVDAKLQLDPANATVLQPSPRNSQTVFFGGSIYCTYRCPSGKTLVEEHYIAPEMTPYYLENPQRVWNFCPSSITMSGN